MKSGIKGILFISVIIILFGCGVESNKKLINVHSFDYVDCRSKSANTIKFEDERVMLVYDQDLDKRDECKNQSFQN